MCMCVSAILCVWVLSFLFSPSGFGWPSSSVWYCRKCGTRYRILLLPVCCACHLHLVPTVQFTWDCLASHTHKHARTQTSQWVKSPFVTSLPRYHHPTQPLSKHNPSLHMNQPLSSCLSAYVRASYKFDPKSRAFELHAASIISTVYYHGSRWPQRIDWSGQTWQ